MDRGNTVRQRPPLWVKHFAGSLGPSGLSAIIAAGDAAFCCDPATADENPMVEALFESKKIGNHAQGIGGRGVTERRVVSNIQRSPRFYFTVPDGHVFGVLSNER